jgi:hypothetical protein
VLNRVREVCSFIIVARRVVVVAAVVLVREAAKHNRKFVAVVRNHEITHV